MIFVATDNVDAEAVQKPKRFNLKSFAVVAILLGLVSTTFDFIYFSEFVKQGEAVLQTAWFMGSILTEILFIFSVRTKGIIFKGSVPSKPLLSLAFIGFTATILIPFTGFGQGVFHFVSLSLPQLSAVLIIAFTYLFVTETVKVIFNKATVGKNLWFS
jgi:Mg2+-importing ATPase